MELNKLEHEIKEKLNGRTLTPSPMAWDRLDAMLTVAEGGAQKPAKKNNRAWLYMAACFLLMLSVGGFLLLHNNTKGGVDTNNTNNVVNTSNKDTKTTTTGTALQPQTQQQQGYAATQQGVAGTQQGSSTVKNNAPQQKAVVLATPFHPLSQESFAQNNNQNPEPAQVNPGQKKISVDANALLASVQTKKAPPAIAGQTQKPANVKVDANALLSGIEGEMELNFRDRMFSKLSKGYEEVKEAVVARNYD